MDGELGWSFSGGLPESTMSGGKGGGERASCPSKIALRKGVSDRPHVSFRGVIKKEGCAGT